MNAIQAMLAETDKRRKADAARFNEHDGDLCQMCHAYGADKRSLWVGCMYAVQEVVPEAIDTFGVESLPEGKRGLYYLRICKNCRGELLGKMGEWANAMRARRSIAKDHDGHDAYDAEGCDIPVRINGRIVMMDAEGYERYRQRADTGDGTP